MKFPLLAMLLLVLPLVSATDHLPRVENVHIDAGNQILKISWNPLDDHRVTGYAVYVYSQGQLVQRIETSDIRANFRGAVNERPYAVQVAAQDAEGMEGPLSVPVGATPTLQRDGTYLAWGLIVVWAGIWLYAVFLTRLDRNLEQRLEQFKNEQENPRAPP